MSTIPNLEQFPTLNELLVTIKYQLKRKKELKRWNFGKYEEE